jgi:hypothetical protein
VRHIRSRLSLSASATNESLLEAITPIGNVAVWNTFSDFTLRNADRAKVFRITIAVRAGPSGSDGS